MSRDAILKVLIDAPVMHAFDYRSLPDELPRPGQRVLVPFRRSRRVGIVAGLAEQSAVESTRLRRILAVLDTTPVLDEKLLELLAWAARYYQHPPGEVFATALPHLLRQGRQPTTGTLVWRATAAGRQALEGGELERTPARARLLAALVRAEHGLEAAELRPLASQWRPAMRILEQHGWIEQGMVDASAVPATTTASGEAPEPTEMQAAAISAIQNSRGFEAFLLQGVTGSGKTEVYLRCIASQLSAGRQSLVLVPEIGLTPQLIARFRQRFPQADIVSFHSGLSDLQRLESWQAAHSGHADIIIGTRSAVFMPLPRPGLLVVDEEHDASLKQQDGFRYSARDIAVWRARQLGMAVVLGSATPSLESLDNANSGRYRRLRLPERTAGARHPEVRLVDLRRHATKDGLTQPLIAAIRHHLDKNGQVLLYLNRRGYAPVLLCPDCGELAECRRCDARMVLHQKEARLRCHHCGAVRPIPQTCSHCGGELVTLGQGTERLEQTLGTLFPEHPMVRIDRDTTRGRGEIGRRLEEVSSGRARILLGTQMLAKGHDFPDVTLVGIIDADQGLFGTDFRAGERLAQTFVQVAGRAGRADRPGEVYIQTLFPDHPLLQTLVREGYERFAERALIERKEAGWPPFRHLAILRAEASSRDTPLDFLTTARSAGEALDADGVRLLGPAPAPMERRAGRYRAQLLVESASRPRLQHFLAAWRMRLDALPATRRVRWSLDVDPVELF